jgi:transcription elongation factor Elf1
MSCIENGHNFEIIRYVKVNNDRVEQQNECMECGEEYSDFIDIKDVNKNEVVSLCKVCEYEIEYDETVCPNCLEDEN